eukprot:3115466-Pyramimonas_sp.AAC.1
MHRLRADNALGTLPVRVEMHTPRLSLHARGEGGGKRGRGGGAVPVLPIRWGGWWGLPVWCRVPLSASVIGEGILQLQVTEIDLHRATDCAVLVEIPSIKPHAYHINRERTIGVLRL